MFQPQNQVGVGGWGSSQIHTHKLKKFYKKNFTKKNLKNNVWLYTAPLIFILKAII